MGGWVEGWKEGGGDGWVGVSSLILELKFL